MKSCFTPLWVYKLFREDGTWMMFYAKDIEEAKEVGKKHGAIHVEKMD
jgi:hypothetical protein